MKIIDRALSVFGLARRSAHPRDAALAELFGGSSQTEAGVSITPANARQCPEVDACVGLIEDTIATVPLDLYERTGAETRERRPEHPLHRLLHDRPNIWQTSAEFRQMLEGWRLVEGNAYARIVMSGRGPVALEPVPPGEMTPKMTSVGPVYVWSPSSTNGLSERRVLLQDEVIHLRGGPPKRFNIIEAESRVVRHRETIALLQASSAYLARFFRNNATPKAAIKLPSLISEAAAAKLRDTWERRHTGVENSHRIAILDGGVDIKPIGLTNEDAQVVQSHDLAVAKVARIFGVPLHLIGETSKSTSWGTGIEQQSIGFVSYYMRPKFVVWEQALNRALMSPETGSRFFYEFNIDGLLRGDFKTRMEGYALLIQWGLAAPNELRRQMNLAPVEGGDDRLMPLNFAPASRIMDVLLRDAGAKSQRDAGEIVDLVTRLLVDPRLSAAAPTGGDLSVSPID